MTDYPSITFGMIVLNGQPFVHYNLRALYPFAHQIIVVEGAAPGAAGVASREGHSTDGTLETLRDFRATEDPEDKMTIVTAEDEGHADGFWPGEKHEMSQAYAKRATGDYLWQVDVDEFYKPEDMRHVLEVIQGNPDVRAVSFRQVTFWGGFDYITDGWYLRSGWCARGIHRLFKWGLGHRYASHRPPTVYDAQGRNLRDLRWIDGESLAARGINLYHYSLVLPKQVMEKCDYYGHADWARRAGAKQWAQEVFVELKNPYRVHNVYDYPSWLERFDGSHPPQIQALQTDLETGRVDVEVRPTDDIEALLASRLYRLGRAGLRVSEPVARRLKPWGDRLSRLRRDPRGSATALWRRAIRAMGR